MRNIKIKICGQRDNIAEVAALQPDYLGYIFWEPSSRYFQGNIPQIDANIQNIGVFVDADVSFVLKQIEKYNLGGVQLHGKESPDYCRKLKEILLEPDGFGKPIRFIKVFSMNDDFDFEVLKSYEEVCDYFLFDTKGKLPGGNGYRFDWKILKHYPSDKPFILSGGIGEENLEDIEHFFKTSASEHCIGLDLNSKFEIEPGLKDVEKLRRFTQKLAVCSGSWQ